MMVMIQDDPLIGASRYFTEYLDADFKGLVSSYGLDGGAGAKMPYQGQSFYDALGSEVGTASGDVTLANSGPTLPLLRFDTIIALI